MGDEFRSHLEERNAADMKRILPLCVCVAESAVSHSHLRGDSPDDPKKMNCTAKIWQLSVFRLQIVIGVHEDLCLSHHAITPRKCSKLICTDPSTAMVSAFPGTFGQQHGWKQRESSFLWDVCKYHCLCVLMTFQNLMFLSFCKGTLL